MRMSSRVRLIFAVGLVGLGLAAAQEQQLPPRELVRRAIANEIRDSDGHQGVLFTYKTKEIKPKQTVVKQIVETPDGTLGRILSVNGKPLTDDEKKKEDERISRLLDPNEMRKKRKSQQEDAERTMKMVRALPDAFVYQQVGTETAPNGHKLVNLKFTPDPRFNPPSRETLVYQGMSGDMIIDTTAMRLAKIDGTLFKDVTIGWGFLARLEKGGQFFVEQNEVYNGHWNTTKMILHFNGRALLFKSIRIDETETTWDYKPVERMSVQQAVNFLKNEEGHASVASTVAEK
jgi:hypothetical protein